MRKKFFLDFSTFQRSKKCSNYFRTKPIPTVNVRLHKARVIVIVYYDHAKYTELMTPPDQYDPLWSY